MIGSLLCCCCARFQINSIVFNANTSEIKIYYQFYECGKVFFIPKVVTISFDVSGYIYHTPFNECSNLIIFERKYYYGNYTLSHMDNSFLTSVFRRLYSLSDFDLFMSDLKLTFEHYLNWANDSYCSNDNVNVSVYCTFGYDDFVAICAPSFLSTLTGFENA